mgnify:CR=1 FL=1
MRSIIGESAIFYGEKHAELDKHVKRAEGNSMKNLIFCFDMDCEVSNRDFEQSNAKINVYILFITLFYMMLLLYR